MGETADAIRDDIERRREAMTDDIQELEDRARSMVDWREQLNERPLAALGVAAAGGLILGMLTGSSSEDKSRDRSYSPSYMSHQATNYPAYGAFGAGQGNGHDNESQASGLTGWISGSQGPSRATDAGKERAASKVDEIRGALMALAAAKAEEFLREAVPGFSQEVDKVKPESDSDRSTGDRQSGGDYSAQDSHMAGSEHQAASQTRRVD